MSNEGVYKLVSQYVGVNEYLLLSNLSIHRYDEEIIVHVKNYSYRYTVKLYHRCTDDLEIYGYEQINLDERLVSENKFYYDFIKLIKI